MRIKPTKPKKYEREKVVCSDCAIGRWSMQQWNRDKEGRPLTKRCEHYNNGAVGIVRGEAIYCDYFKQQTNNTNN